MACDACGKGDPATEFRGTMQKLWADHMQWTYSTVDAFFHNPSGLDAQLNRLLKNQKDIGAAIVPVYGQAAGDKLAGLLTTHINQAVPVLTAAKNNDQPALKKALDDWYANAQEIADFLAEANPKNWKQSELREMMKKHIDTTTGYAVELLKGNYAEAVKKYDEANDHMKQMSDELAAGIIKQFPEKFKKADIKKK
jgi:malate synthase